jgi:hypothetical protein
MIRPGKAACAAAQGKLGLAVLASASVTAVLGFAVYMFAEGYSGGGDPQSVASLAFRFPLPLASRPASPALPHGAD